MQEVLLVLAHLYTLIGLANNFRVCAKEEVKTGDGHLCLKCYNHLVLLARLLLLKMIMLTIMDGPYLMKLE